MRYSCLHTHSVYCDGKDEIEKFCETAYLKGFDSLGFSAHAPLNGIISTWHMKKERLEEYLSAVKTAREKWKDKLRIFLGLEVDYIEGYSSPLDFQKYDLDYIIGAIHYVIPPHDGEPFAIDGPVDEFEKGLKESFSNDIHALVEAYWQALTAMIKAGGFDILAHIDLIKKNNFGEKYYPLDPPPYLTRTYSVAELLRGSSIVVEINTGGLNRNKTKDCYPGRHVLRQLKANNVPIIITADAHRAEHINGNYDKARDSLLSAGYIETLFFEGRENGKVLWSADTLL